MVEYCQATDLQIEGCLSSRSECCIGHVRRVKELAVEYYDERGRQKKKHASRRRQQLPTSNEKHSGGKRQSGRQLHTGLS